MIYLIRFRLCLLLTIIVCTPFAFSLEIDPKAAGELKQGRYVGFVELDESGVRLATVVDFYVESSEDLREFPKLNAGIKISLGGYNTSEYYTEIFEDLRYDYDYGTLTLDESSNDLMLTGDVTNAGSSATYKGRAYIRSSGISGTFDVSQISDEPGDDDDEPGASRKRSAINLQSVSSRFVPALQGQYKGSCGVKPAVFQIQTVRGLRDLAEREAGVPGFSHGYAIAGRLAFRGSEVCNDERNQGLLCVYKEFNSMSYNPFLGKLNVSGDSTDACTLVQGDLRCSFRLQNESTTCVFKKEEQIASNPVFYTRRFNVRPTPGQRIELPPPNPPRNENLKQALQGDFWGYLHNETNDKYQLVKLNVTPYSSTNNPHNPNQMMITATASVYLGKTPTDDFYVQRFEPRSFYLRPGFTLSGPNSDSYINVSEWKTGYLSGTWYSHAFGKVGTVQLIKGTVPELPAGALLMRGFSGEFNHTITPSREPMSRWLKLVFPSQPSNLKDNLIRLVGSYQALVGVTPVKGITEGYFDPFLGVFGWKHTRGEDYTLISGKIEANGDLKVLWPGAPGVFGVITPEMRQTELFVRAKTN